MSSTNWHERLRTNSLVGFLLDCNWPIFFSYCVCCMSCWSCCMHKDGGSTRGKSLPWAFRCEERLTYLSERTMRDIFQINIGYKRTIFDWWSLGYIRLVDVENFWFHGFEIHPRCMIQDSSSISPLKSPHSIFDFHTKSSKILPGRCYWPWIARLAIRQAYAWF